MVDVSGETTQFESALGGMMDRPGPIARAIQAEHKDRFTVELLRLIDLEDGIEVKVQQDGMAWVFIPGTEHGYWVYSGLAYAVKIDTDLWTAHVAVSYIAEPEDEEADAPAYHVLEEKNRVGVYRDPEFCAALAVNAVKAHRAAGFAELATEPQYNVRTGLPFGVFAPVGR